MFISCPAAQIPPSFFPKIPIPTQWEFLAWLDGCSDLLLSILSSLARAGGKFSKSAAIPCLAKPQQEEPGGISPKVGNLNEEQPWTLLEEKEFQKETKWHNLGVVTVRGRL